MFYQVPTTSSCHFRTKLGSVSLKIFANEKNLLEKIIFMSSNCSFFYIIQFDQIITDDALFLLEEAEQNSLELALIEKILAWKM
jgi:hypothetical protein